MHPGLIFGGSGAAETTDVADQNWPRVNVHGACSIQSQLPPFCFPKAPLQRF